jgi:hypothetical protein
MTFSARRVEALRQEDRIGEGRDIARRIIPQLKATFCRKAKAELGAEFIKQLVDGLGLEH